MTEKREALCKFFADKARHLQNEIDMEIEKIGGEGMLISREDLIHWVYHAREQEKTYRIICSMLEDRAESTDNERILMELRETIEADRTDIDRIRRKQEEEQKALARLHEEADYYQQALEVLENRPSEKRNET